MYVAVFASSSIICSLNELEKRLVIGSTFWKATENSNRKTATIERNNLIEFEFSRNRKETSGENE
jgi:hypothetical protein